MAKATVEWRCDSIRLWADGKGLRFSVTDECGDFLLAKLSK